MDVFATDASLIKSLMSGTYTTILLSFFRGGHWSSDKSSKLPRDTGSQLGEGTRLTVTQIMVCGCHSVELAFQKELPHGPIYCHVPSVPRLAHLSVVLSIASLHSGELLGHGNVKISKHLSVNDFSLEPAKEEKGDMGIGKRAWKRGSRGLGHSCVCFCPRMCSVPFNSHSLGVSPRPGQVHLALEGARANQTSCCS